MRIIKIFSFTALYLIVLLILTKSDNSKHAFSAEFNVTSVDDPSYYGKGTYEIFRKGNSVESKLFIDEQSNKGKISGEILKTGEISPLTGGGYSYSIDEFTANFSNFGKKNFPMSKIASSSKKRLHKRHPVDIISSTDKYIVIATYLNGGQVIALERH
ncbi:hypothetical protein GCM10007938_35870 [Vibrio zhanjiangensis]|uniref:Uncharacterized protein n=1 Tax=Vibrio zhanjiangensis TaxID=1046128 RepID=A0ABQ6F493_9VIBR|nr:hypothetical protein [Vibrio zhanjiangensis]GLT19804.1 hypothetical protein GCM10007938_35870 [Vibrio zhanjiangensis]